MVSPFLSAAAPSPLDQETEFNKTMRHSEVPFEACCLSLWEQRVKQGVELRKAPVQLPFRFGWG